jgi:hypothetical protein
MTGSARDVEDPPAVETPRPDWPVRCQVCGAPRRPDDSALCPTCGEPVIVWGWAP